MDTVLLSVAGYDFTLPAAASVLAGVVALVVGLAALVRERRGEESLYLLFFCIVVGAWLIASGFMYAAPERIAARDWMHVAYMALPFVPATIYRFTVQILGGNPRRRLVMGAIWVAAALLVVLAVGAGAFGQRMVRFGWGWTHTLDADGALLVAYVAGALGAALLEFGVAAHAASAERRRPLLLLMVGFGVGGLAMVDFLPGFASEIPPLGYVPVTLGLLCVAHVVRRYRLVDLTPSFTAETILATLADPVLVIDDEGVVRFASAAAAGTFSWERLEGAPWQELVPEGDRKDVARLIAAHETDDLESRLLTGSGEEAPAALTASPLAYPDGGRAGTVLVARDLREREAARRAVERAERKFSRLFELNPLAIGLATLDGSRFLEVNEAFERYFGIPREEAIGQSPLELGLWVDPADRERIAERIRRGSTVDGTEVRMRGADGEVREVLFFADGVQIEGTPALLAMAYDITDRKAFERELERRALYDSLTGLPNRSLLHDRLDLALHRARREGSRVAVLFLDLDRFKVVNDSLGHAAGDELLQRVAARFRRELRDEDTVARVGGDEFVAVLEDVERAADAETGARRLIRALESPITIDGREVHLDVSVGIAISEAGDESSEELIRRADVAMYRIKKEGGDDHGVFDPVRDAGASERLRMENDLRRAIECDELVLHYQPVIELATGAIEGAEALVRWKHPERGLVQPDEFIPLAEETGLIVPLGSWVLRNAARTVAGWGRERDAPLYLLGVNVSAHQLREADIVSRIREVLAETEFRPDRLVVEVTESAVVQRREVVRELQEIGVRVAVDDLGTGYASLEFLTHLDIDLMKVDRSFVAGIGSDVRDEAIVEAAGHIARRIGLSLVGEGVETAEQLVRLRELGYDFGQGFYFAEPMPAAEFERLLSEMPPWAEVFA